MNPYLIPDDDTELDMREMLRYVLKHWLLLFAAGIICACLVCGYKVVQQRDLPKEDVRENETEAEEQEASYQAESELYGGTVGNINDNLKSQKDYLRNSVLMKVDPYAVPAASTVITISSDAPDRQTAAMVSNEYRRDLLQGGYLDEMAKKEGLSSSAYLGELISVEILSEDESSDSSGQSSSVSDTQGADSSISVDMNSAGHVEHRRILLTVIGEDQDQADRILDGVLDEAEKVGKTLSGEYRFEAETDRRTRYTLVNSTVLNRQSNFYSAVWNLSSMRNNIKGSLDALQKPEDSAASAAMSGVSRKTLAKYGLIGFLAGFVLVFLLYVIRFVSNDKLVSYKDLSNRFVLRDLGTYDRTDVSVAMIDANLNNYAGNAHRILLAGTVDASVLTEVGEKLREKDSSYELLTAGRILSSPESRKALTDADAVILIEEKGVSRYSDMKQETEFISNAQKPIIGIVIC